MMRLLLVLFFSVSLASCFDHPGGIGDDSDRSNSSVQEGITLSSDTSCLDQENLDMLEAGGVVYGCVIDSLVTGIDYITESQSGTTDQYGRFRFKQNENITFKIGDLSLPTVAASVEVTPFTIGGTDDVTNPVVRNIGLLLQSLDNDANPDNGITLTQEIKDKFIDFPHTSTIFSEVDVETFKNYFAGILIDGANPIAFRTVAEVETHLGKIVPVYGRWYSSIGETDADLALLFIRQNDKYSYLEQATGKFEVGTVSRVGNGIYSFTTLTTPVSGLAAAGAVSMNFSSDSLEANILSKEYFKGYSFSEMYGEAATDGFRNLMGGWELVESSVITGSGVYFFVDPNESFGLFRASSGIATAMESGDISIGSVSSNGDGRFKATVTIDRYDDSDPVPVLGGLVPNQSRTFILSQQEDAATLTIEEPCATCGVDDGPGVVVIARFNRVL